MSQAARPGLGANAFGRLVGPRLLGDVVTVDDQQDAVRREHRLDAGDGVVHDARRQARRRTASRRFLTRRLGDRVQSGWAARHNADTRSHRRELTCETLTGRYRVGQQPRVAFFAAGTVFTRSSSTFCTPGIAMYGAFSKTFVV